MSDQSCTHIGDIATIKQPQQYQCEQCAKMGSGWVHLRTCQESGRTHCCDSSTNRHATGHAHATGYPVIASAEPGERWLLELAPKFGGPARQERAGRLVWYAMQRRDR